MSYLEDPNLVVEPDHYETGIPVFKPTYSQFQDFYKFNKAINKYGMQSGIVKIIPPKEWLRTTASSYNTKSLETVKIKNPIIQNINQVENGVYTQQNIERPRTYSIFQWKDLSEKAYYQPPATKRNREDAKSKDDKAKTSKPVERMDVRITRNRDSNTKNTQKNDYNIDTAQFTPERCEQLEKTYWKSVTYAGPMYGADCMGSLFSNKVKSWNVAHLPNLLDLMDVKLPGVNDAYLYAGLWKATFAWHLEDQDLYSINYLHFGAPKQWYSIPQDECDNFFNLMKDTFYDEYKNCPEFLRHKTFLVSPQFLDKHGIRYNKIVHSEKEFIITYPYGYHAGFNYGYNLAESVNFALDDWFEYGGKTKKCECILDSVGINVKQLYCRYKGIPYEVPELTSDDGDEEDDVEPKEVKRQVKPKTERKKRPAKKEPKEVPRVKKEQKLKEKHLFECYLCPNNIPEKLKKSQFDLLDTDLGSHKVHRICSLTFPNELKNVRGKIHGLSDISKAQKNLKCLTCGKKINGACFQCSFGKCCRAYHATCSISDGVTFDFPKNGFYCKYHYPKNNSAKLIPVAQIKPGTIVQLKNSVGGCGFVVSTNPFVVESIPSGELKQIDPTDLLTSDGMVKLDDFFVNYKPDRKRKREPTPDDELVTGLDDTNLNLIKQENFIIETVQRDFPSTQFKELWYNLPRYSSDQIDRYTNDVKVQVPNDPYTLKQMRRKKRSFLPVLIPGQDMNLPPLYNLVHRPGTV